MSFVIKQTKHCTCPPLNAKWMTLFTWLIQNRCKESWEWKCRFLEWTDDTGGSWFTGSNCLIAANVLYANNQRGLVYPLTLNQKHYNLMDIQTVCVWDTTIMGEILVKEKRKSSSLAASGPNWTSAGKWFHRRSDQTSAVFQKPKAL